MSASDLYRIYHHTHYKEIDGYDEVVISDKGKHIIDHKQPRNNGRFAKNPRGTATTTAQKAGQRLISKIKTLRFYTGIEKYTRLVEIIRYAPTNGNVSYTCTWEAFYNERK